MAETAAAAGAAAKGAPPSSPSRAAAAGGNYNPEEAGRKLLELDALVPQVAAALHQDKFKQVQVRGFLVWGCGVCLLVFRVCGLVGGRCIPCFPSLTVVTNQHHTHQAFLKKNNDLIQAVMARQAQALAQEAGGKGPAAASDAAPESQPHGEGEGEEGAGADKALLQQCAEMIKELNDNLTQVDVWMGWGARIKPQCTRRSTVLLHTHSCTYTRHHPLSK